MENIYLGRQPILEGKGGIFAYEILYRDKNKQSNVVDDRFASAYVINNVLNKFGTDALLGGRRGFVKIDEKFLMNDIIFSIPNQFFVFSILGNVEMNEKVVERIQQLFAKDYILGIHDISLSEDTFNKYTKVFKELSFFKLRLKNDMDTQIKNLISALKSHNIKVIGTSIEDSFHYDLAKKNGCDFFQGYFFAKPNIIESAKYEPSRFHVLKLYNLLIQDTNIDEITSEFEHNHAITVQLLQFVNSCAFHFRNRISSIHHILVLVGRKPLAQWLMLMIYSKSISNANESPPLMLLVKSRTELMEGFLKALHPDAKHDALGEAYFVGVLSLMDTLFGKKMEEILEHIQVTDEVKDALLKHKGILGELYVLVCEIEKFNTHAIADFTDKHNLKAGTIEAIVMKSIENVNIFENALSLKREY
ncbi:HDOD domain-containing protein [bacterium]|nr:HDOD domain-containing protein [bacterium]MBU1994896.1 HDOD domain-containing protein [bacterium]